jgi:hypothetical protein
MRLHLSRNFLSVVVGFVVAFGAAFPGHAQFSTTPGTPPTIYPADPSANLAIGTTVSHPFARLTLAGAETFRVLPNPYAGNRLIDFDFNHSFSSADLSKNGAGWRIDLRWDLGTPAFSWFTRNAGQAAPNTYETQKMYLDGTGVLAIGYQNPTGNTTDKLQVNGNVYSAGNITSAGTISGGNVIAKYQDVAEWVPASGDIPAATVVVLDPSRANHVRRSSTAYDETVAGVVSAQPGIVLGEEDASKVKVATTGRVRVRVDASRRPIRIGDLLVTSDKPGIAMRSEPIEVAGARIHRPGTVIGKALQPLASGEGEILVLLSLQ